MTQYGFRLIELRLSGKDVEDAFVHFEKGLNVICGPSDTGKSFILQCIDFIFGSESNPKDIDEREGYDAVELTISTYSDNTCYTLKRDLNSNTLEVSQEDTHTISLQSKHSKSNKHTISNFLLKLSGLSDKLLRKNKDGKTVLLSFRNLARLFLVPEDQIIKEISPVLTGQYITKTSETSLFKLLLSGIDDSSVVDTSVTKTSKAKIESKNELLRELIYKIHEEYENLNVIGSYEELLEQLQNLNLTYDVTLIELKSAQNAVHRMEQARSNRWENLRKLDSRLKVLSELSARFNILKSQYNSDIERLTALAETGSRLTEVELDHCLVCGATSEHHQVDYKKYETHPNIIAHSCEAEIEKIHSLVSNLESTQLDITNEKNFHNDNKKSIISKLKKIENTIKEKLNPKLKLIIQKYKESLQKKFVVQKAIELQNRIFEYKNLIQDSSQIENASSDSSETSTLSTRNTEEFSLEVERRLKKWNFPDMDRVTFDSDKIDIVISGKSRDSHGKGVRAITHAAFSLAILNYCKNKVMPHPGFLIMDSPLVVYREADANDLELTPDVKNSFYADIASSFAEVQVIILENDEPPSDLEHVNLISFTKTNTGRYGFIPSRDKN